MEFVLLEAKDANVELYLVRNVFLLGAPRLQAPGCAGHEAGGWWWQAEAAGLPPVIPLGVARSSDHLSHRVGSLRGRGGERLLFISAMTSCVPGCPAQGVRPSLGEGLLSTLSLSLLDAACQSVLLGKEV